MLARTHHEGRVVAQGEQPQPETVEDVYHPSHARVLAESDDPLPSLVHQLFVVDQSNVLKHIILKLANYSVHDTDHGSLVERRQAGNPTHCRVTRPVSVLYLRENSV